MSRKTTRRTAARQPAATKTPVTPRAVLLAGLGAVSLGRKQAQASLETLAANAGDLRSRADEAAREAGARIARLREQAETKLAPVLAQAETFALIAERQFETSCAPLLTRLGVTAKPARRKPARRATGGRRARKA